MPTDVLPWLEYHWDFGFPVGMYRAILERLRGTPARVDALVAGVPAARLVRRDGDRWSAQEHVGRHGVLRCSSLRSRRHRGCRRQAHSAAPPTHGAPNRQACLSS